MTVMYVPCATPSLDQQLPGVLRAQVDGLVDCYVREEQHFWAFKAMAEAVRLKPQLSAVPGRAKSERINRLPFLFFLRSIFIYEI